MEAWPDYLRAATAGLHELMVTGTVGETPTVSEGYSRWLTMTRDGWTRSQHIFFVGNGASAMLAGHFAADACKNAALNALAFNDAALLTATANDIAFEEVFALPLTRLGRAGDLLVAISSSGNSPNILRAIDAARSISAHVVTLTGMRADNLARARGDLNFYVPLSRYGWIECAHQLILHYWLDQYLILYGNGAI